MILTIDSCAQFFQKDEYVNLKKPNNTMFFIHFY